MTGKIALLDTNVIIDNAKAKLSMQNIVNKYSQIFISIITYVEILGFNFKNEVEQKLIVNLIRNLPISYIDLKIADFAVKYRQLKKIKLADSLIFATAKSLNADLITSNVSDFINFDKSIRIIKPAKL